MTIDNPTWLPDYDHPNLMTARDIPDMSGAEELRCHTLYRFYSGYGASVVFHDHSYGLELAVIGYTTPNSWEIIYWTPITSDVVGHIPGRNRLRKILDRIGDLTPDARLVGGFVPRPAGEQEQ